MRLVFMGSPEFAVPPLQQLVRSGWEVVAVYTQADKPFGRGQEMTASAVKIEARALDLPVFQPKSLRDGDAQTELAGLEPDVIVVAAYGQILPPSVLSLPRCGCLNIHPSLLPRHRGAAPVAATILNGDTWAGTTIMLMGEGLDTGPVLAQAQVLIRDEDTAGSVSARLSIVSAALLADVLPRWVRGEIVPRTQDDTQATYFKSMCKEAGEIDWHLSAVEIWRRVRAFQPWPGAFTRYQGKLLKILEAKPVVAAPGGVVGQVIGMDKDFGIVTGNGVLEVVRVQMEGKQVITAAEFTRGQRSFTGVVLPS
jgi:methionyl-tRNA formyltransferase